jgi:cell shape-determining protein MreC
MKTIIDFEPSKSPKKDDIIVYDPFEQRFIQVSKTSFFSGTNKELKTIHNEIETMKQEIALLKEQNIKLAKILKGELQ